MQNKNNNPKVKVGDTIKIVVMQDPYSPDYSGKIGTVQYIDDAGQLYGTWGGLAVIPEIDLYIKL